jgi:hypothetical protein
MSDYTPEPGVAGAPSVSTCQKDGCGLALPVKGEQGFHPMRKYCDDHQPKAKYKEDRMPPSAKGPTINVNIPKPNAPKKGTELEKLEEGAQRLLGFLPLTFALANDEVCMTAVQQALPQIAHQLALVAEYHPGLAKILAPVESTGEAMAWMGLVMAITPVILAILSHHNLLPKKIGETLGAAFSMVPQAA